MSLREKKTHLVEIGRPLFVAWKWSDDSPRRWLEKRPQSQKAHGKRLSFLAHHASKRSMISPKKTALAFGSKLRFPSMLEPESLALRIRRVLGRISRPCSLTHGPCPCPTLVFTLYIPLSLNPHPPLAIGKHHSHLISLHFSPHSNCSSLHGNLERQTP